MIRNDKNDLIRRGDAEHRAYTKCAGRGDYVLAQACKDTINAIPPVVSAGTTRRKVWIVWDASLSQGVVLTDREKADDMLRGVYTAGDLTEAMATIHGGEVLTLDAVELEVRT